MDNCKTKRTGKDYGFIFALVVGIGAILLGRVIPSWNMHVTTPGISILVASLVWYFSENLLATRKISEQLSSVNERSRSILRTANDVRNLNKVELITNVRDASHWEKIDDDSEIVFFNALWVLTHATFGDTFVRMISRGIKWRIVYFEPRDASPNDRYENMKAALRTIRERGDLLDTRNLTIYKGLNPRPGTSFFLFKSGGNNICRIYADLLLSKPSTGQVIPTFAFDCHDEHLYSTLRNHFHMEQVPENDVTNVVLQEIEQEREKKGTELFSSCNSRLDQHEKGDRFNFVVQQ